MTSPKPVIGTITFSKRVSHALSPFIHRPMWTDAGRFQLPVVRDSPFVFVIPDTQATCTHRARFGTRTGLTSTVPGMRTNVAPRTFELGTTRVRM